AKKSVMKTAFDNALGVEDGTKKIDAKVIVTDKNGKALKLKPRDIIDIKHLDKDKLIIDAEIRDKKRRDEIASDLVIKDDKEPAWLTAYREALQKQIDADKEAKQKIVDANKQMANDLMQLY